MKNPVKLLYLLALLRLVLGFVLQHPVYQPHRDEFLYLDYGNHMAWGYMEVPPLLSLFSWITQLLGNTLFMVKFWPALFGTFTFILCGKIMLTLGGRSWAIMLLFLAFVFGAHLRVFFLFQPGFLEIFSWTAIAYSFIRFQQTGRNNWLYIFGIACGVGLLVKYTTAFYITGLVAALVLTPQRNIFRKKVFYIAAAIALLIFLPNLIWQYQHRFPVLSHMKELRETQLVYLNPKDFLMGQLMLHFVVSFIWLAGLFALLFTRALKPYRWYAFTYLFVLALLMAGSGKEYYALGLYPVLFAFGAVHLEAFFSTRHVVFKWALTLIPLGLGLFIIPLGLPAFKPEKLAAYYETTGMRQALGFKWEDQEMHPLPQDFADMIGWKEIAEMTARHYHQLPDSIKEETVIYCRGYFTAGAINFYGKKLNLPKAISDNGSYLWWMPQNFDFKHLLLLSHRKPAADDEAFNQFEQSYLLDSLQMPLAREHGIKLRLYQNGNDSLSIIVENIIGEARRQFSR